MEVHMQLNNTLRSGSHNYHNNVGNFIRFNEAHDKKQFLVKYLKPIIKNKIVLDIGCGYGKYLGLFSSTAKKIVGIDLSCVQIELAKSSAPKNVKVFCCSAEHMPVDDNSIDVCLSIYGAISVEKDLRCKSRILKEVMRVLKPNGAFYVITDAFTGDWVKLKSRTKSHRGFEWLLANGFKRTKLIHSDFSFKSSEEAKAVMHSLFGRVLSVKIKKALIKQNMMILKVVKNVL